MDALVRIVLDRLVERVAADKAAATDLDVALDRVRGGSSCRRIPPPRPGRQVLASASPLACVTYGQRLGLEPESRRQHSLGLGAE